MIKQGTLNGFVRPNPHKHEAGQSGIESQLGQDPEDQRRAQQSFQKVPTPPEADNMKEEEDDWTGPEPIADSSVTCALSGMPYPESNRPILTGDNQTSMSHKQIGKRKLPRSFCQAQQTYGNERQSEGSETTRRQSLRSANLPTFGFTSNDACYYANTRGEVEYLCEELLKSGVKATGWDLEWKIQFKRNEPAGRVALMQVCYQQKSGSNKILLLHIFHTSIPASLRNYLLDESIVKTGVNAHLDKVKMSQDYGIEVAGVVDLVNHPLVLKCREQNIIPNSSLAGCHLPKEAVRVGNWEQKPLSYEQQLYAARDALASLRVYLVVEERLANGFSVDDPNNRNAATIPEGRTQLANEILNANPHDRNHPDAQQDGPASAKPSSSSLQINATRQEIRAIPGAKWVEAANSPQRLSPCKMSAHDLFFVQGLSLAQISERGGIKESTVGGYLTDAIMGGMPYTWPLKGIPQAQADSIMKAIDQLSATAGVEEFVSSSIPGVQVLRLRAIEDALGGDCDMVILRLVQAHHFRQHLCAKAKIQ